MTTAEKIAELNTEIEQVALDFEQEKERLERELIAATKKRDTFISKLQQERDDVAMKEKLKQFPRELIKNHKVCNVCGSPMRPFAFADLAEARPEGQIVKAWACSTGNLQPGHDLVRV